MSTVMTGRRDSSVGHAAPHYVLALLYAGYVLNFVDRQLLTLLLNDVKRDLHLADWQLGLASGTAFATLYVVASIPIAHMADRSNRIRLLSACVAVWSLMTAACGLVTNVVQLLLARMGVAIGEAGGQPASLSLIADLFPPEVRSSKLGIYFSAAAIGTMLSYAIGGYVNAAIGWRWTFLIFAVPGVLLAATLMLTVREPARGGIAGQQQRSMRQAFLELVRIPLFNRLCVAFALANLSLYSLLTWAPSLALRSYDLGTATVGLVMGVVGGGVSALGMIAAGRASDRLARISPGAPLYLVAVGMLLLGLLIPACLFSSSFTRFALFFAVCYAVGASYAPPAIGVIQAVVAPDLRAMASAILFMVGTLAGLGLGPLMVGALSDWLRPGAGDASLQHALLILSPIALLGALSFAEAGRHRNRSAAS